VNNSKKKKGKKNKKKMSRGGRAGVDIYLGKVIQITKKKAEIRRLPACDI
jgi:hypothetical protein